jgi:hypothetical protein
MKDKIIIGIDTAEVKEQPQFRSDYINFPYYDKLFLEACLEVGQVFKVFGLTVMPAGYVLHASPEYDLETGEFTDKFRERETNAMEFFCSNKFRETAELIEGLFCIKPIFRFMKQQDWTSMRLTCREMFLKVKTVEPFINFSLSFSEDKRGTWLVEKQQKRTKFAHFDFLVNEVDWDDIGTPSTAGLSKISIKKIDGIDMY